ncbi:hypothetical protein [Nitrobacter sp. TKz-YC01]|uniref:hypothetical protein n=1 Tax=Nitrobacter sp. TKz-YC01 TaxID=3398703 RepID=UPI003A0FCF8D
MRETAYQAVALYLMLLYYPFTTESRDIFSANAPTAVFLDWLRGMRDESHRECARYEYLIIRASEHPSIRTTAAGIMYCTGTRTTPCSIRSMRAMETV